MNIPLRAYGGVRTDFKSPKTGKTLGFKQSLILLLLLSFFGNAWGQTIIFSENIGTPTTTTAISSYAGWQNNGVLTFTGTGDVRSSLPSTGYAGASGTGTVFITGTNGLYFEIAGINTSAYSNLALTFGEWKSGGAGAANLLVVEVSSDGINYTSLSYTRSDGSTWALISPTGTIPSTSNLRIRFRNPGTTQQFRVDDIKLTGIVSVPCSGTPSPGNTIASVNPVTGGGTTVLSLQSITSGSGVTYQWQSSTDGITYANISGATSSTYTATVNAKTWYKCVVTCSGTSSGISSPVLVTMTYCVPTYSTGPGTGDNIANVTLGSLNNSSGSSSAPYYTFYNAVTVPNINQGSTASVTVTFGSDSNQFGGVWIDFNQNGIFEASEGFVSTNAGAGGNRIFNFTVPSGAVLGQTRMRVRGGDDSALTTAQACGASNSAYGETEDYIVNITAAAPDTSVSTATLSGFAATTASDSAPKSFKVSGALLGTSPIVVKPSAGYEISLTSASGYSSADIPLTPTSGTVPPTDIYVILKMNAVTGSVNGSINVHSDAVSTDKTVTLAGSINKATFNSAGNGNWETPGTWDLNAVPGADDNVVINAAHTVTATTAKTRNAGSTTTVTGTLATTATYTNNGSTTVNGTFQINNGGYAEGNAFSYHDTTGVLTFNTDANYGVNNGDAYWPTTSGPMIINVLKGGFILNSANRTVNTISTSGGVSLNNSALTVNTTAQINAGGYFSNIPIYGTLSTLIYNGVSGYDVGNEWTANSGSAGAGAPQHVTLTNSSVNSPGAARGLAGNLSVSAGSIFRLNGDLYLGGNWANGGSFEPNTKAVFFNGAAGTQTITNTNAANANTESFAYLINHKAAGSLTLASNVNVTGNAGDVLQIVNGGATNLAGKTLSLTGNGGNVLVSGAARTITGSSGAVFEIKGNKTVVSGSGGSLVIGANITTKLSAGVDFGSGNLTTINNILEINNGGYVIANAPIYGSSSALNYNTGTSSTYNVNNEWNADGTAVGAGIPPTVNLNTSAVNIPAGNRAVINALNINNGSTLTMASGAVVNDMGTVTNASGGTFGMNNGATFNIVKSWTNNGTFNANNGLVAFVGAVPAAPFYAAINGATNFDHLKVDKSGDYVQLAAHITVNRDLTLTNRSISLSGFNLTLPNKSSVISSNTNSYINATGTGKLIRRNLDGTADWVFPMGVALTGRYAPITFKNLSGTTDLSLNVSATLTPSVSDATKVLKTEWMVTTTNNVTADIFTEWQGAAEQGAGMTVPAPGDLGVAVGTAPYELYPVNLVVSSTFANAVSLSNTAANGIVIGNSGGVKLQNDDCSGAINVVVDAAAISGALKGATKSLDPDCGGIVAANDVWYKFTTTDAGNYTIIVDGAFNSVLNLRSGGCNGTSVQCVDNTTTGPESITASLDANTTYYYRIYSYSYNSTSPYPITTQVTTVPTLSLNPTSLAFGDVPENSVSANKLFTVKGSFLNPAVGNINLSAVSGYQYSLDGVTDWQTTLSLPYTGKKLNETTVYARLHSTAACTDYNGTVIVSGGGAASVNFAVTGKGIVQAPVAHIVADNDITATTFLASWDAVPGATNYILEVSTSPTFGTYSTGSASESFNNSNFNTGYYTTATNVSLDSGMWNMYQVLKTTSNYISAPAGVQMRAGQGILITPAFDGIKTISFNAKRTGSTANKIIISKIVGDVETEIDRRDDNTTITAYSVPVNETSSGVKIKIVSNSNTIYLDDVKIDYEVNDPDFVAPYQKLNVGDVTSYLVDLNLLPNTQYYYRVRALNSNLCESPNSNVIPVLTKNDAVVWYSAKWSNITGPTENLNSIIRDAYHAGDPDRPSFETKNLKVESNGLLTIGKDQHVTVHGLINTVDDKIIVEDDGMLHQIGQGDNTGKITVKRNVTFTTARQQYNYMISPVKDQKMKYIFGADGSGVPYIQYVMRLNEPTNIFVNDGDGIYAQGKGYAVKEAKNDYVSNDGVAIFKGVPANSDFEYALSNTPNRGYNLSGNPYPSNLDLTKLYEDSKNSEGGHYISSTIRFWDNKSNDVIGQQGGAYQGYAYAVFNASSGVGTKAPGSATITSSGKKPNQYVKVGQGFLVKAVSNSPKLIFRNSQRDTAAAESGFFGKEAAKDRYWLELKTPSDFTISNAIVYFDAGTNSFAEDDTRIPNSAASDALFSYAGDAKVVINGRNTFANQDVISLGLRHFVAGSYTISVHDAGGRFATGQSIYLKDKLLGILTDLTAGDYTFTSEAGEFTNRFEIVYKPATTLGTAHAAGSGIEIYREGSSFVIRSSGEKITNAELYDAAGRLLLRMGASTREVRFEADRLADGMYVVKTLMSNGESLSKKIRK
ncbi:beta strand repeat-containing protein [Chryseobacterium sp. VAUSW3]|uniref:beta strand repeat-containing protein n=1 Tax=Chryseobacterium sp. VAUSW3 TaxID=2010998 RepID=UPI000B4D7220|nr:GEVED domain-containing protein [Chryseobacterium sp. VAUSW3]OWR15161.1 hypothetical protein CDW55_01650 [Chryseobacterium sp. VAUSW3]